MEVFFMCIHVHVWLRERVSTQLCGCKWLQYAFYLTYLITICVCVWAGGSHVSMHMLSSLSESMECADKGGLDVDVPRLRIPLLCAHRIASHPPIAYYIPY